jgi:hypothetical protein
VDQLVHAGVEALAFGAPVQRLVLVLLAAAAGGHAVQLDQEAAQLVVVLKTNGNIKSGIQSGRTVWANFTLGSFGEIDKVAKKNFGYFFHG